MEQEKISIQIEILTNNHLHDITNLSLKLWPENEYKKQYAEWEEILNHTEHFCAVIISENTIFGFIHLSIRKEYVEGSNFNTTAYVEAIYIEPEFRKKGFATLLLQKGISWAKSKDLHELASDTELGNIISQKFHTYNGFKEVTKLVCYIKSI